MLGILQFLIFPIAQAAPPEVFETTLPNGLRIIVREDHRSPTLAHLVWYRAGSIDESYGRTGVAHVLEHMMFKGTKNLKPGEFSKTVAEAGGRDNAFTSHDNTVYFQQYHRSQLELAMRLEADRMVNLQMNQQDYAKELQVVMEERRLRTDDVPRSLLYEKLRASIYAGHPYYHPIIGWMGDLQNLKLEDAKRWYDTWYVPNNAVLIVVGDVKPSEVVALARRYYGPIARRSLPERKEAPLPPQNGLRRIHLKAPADLPYLLLAWPVPVIRNLNTDRDPLALEVLAGILSGYEGARLEQNLVRRLREAHEASAGYDSIQRGPGIFILDGSPGKGKSIAELETALKAEISKIAKEGVSTAELQRIKAQIIAGQVYKRDSIFGQAIEIGNYLSAGLSLADINRHLEQLRTVTSEEVQAVANRYFSEDQLTIAQLDPLPLPTSPTVPSTALPKSRHE